MPPRPTLRRLHPSPAAETTVAEHYAIERPRRTDRPWIGLCMVASLDGSVAVEGTSGGLGNPNDLEVLLTLRRTADLVLVGAGTVRGEGYGPPEKAGQRIGVVTNRGSVDLDRELFTSGAGFLVAPASAEIDESRVEVLRSGEQEVDLAAAVRRFTEIAPDVRFVQAEGGPRLNGSLLAVDAIDELNLTMSPRLVGGRGPRVTTGAPEVDHRFSLAHLLTDDDGYVFTRWVRRNEAA